MSEGVTERLMIQQQEGIKKVGVSEVFNLQVRTLLCTLLRTYL